MKKFIIYSIIVILVAVGITLYQINVGQKSISIPLRQENNNNTQEKSSQRIEIVASNLEIPWEIVFLPVSQTSGSNKDILVTERVGRLSMVSGGQTKTIAKIEDVKVIGEGGLMGMALHPNFQNNNYIYFYYTYAGQNSDTKNRLVRYKLKNDILSDRKILIDNIPGAVFHNGGRIKFGPDKFLYITTGDSLEPSLAQNTNSLAGKILRITDEGKVPLDNPFTSIQDKPFARLVYSYGHRNPQGLSWDDKGRLWATEHGNSTKDEINVIVKGKNYGWPTITGDELKDGMESPFAQSGSETWAPAGSEFLNGSLFFGGLRGQALFDLKVSNGNAIITKHFLEEFGRIRAVTAGPDGFLYISTSNRDGRGTVKESDDKIIKVDISKL